MALQRYDFKTSMPLVGFCVAPARGSETVSIQSQGFYTSDDGPHLYTLLDELYGALFTRHVPVEPERIRNALISITDRTHTTVLVNPGIEMKVLHKGLDLKSGDPVFDTQIVDIVSIRIPEYELPRHGAIAYLFQHGWRRGFYFDFSANQSENRANEPLGDVAALLGSLHSALLLRDWVRMDPTVLEKMAATGWFPFARLPKAQAKNLYRHFEYGWEPAAPIEQIVNDVGPRIARIVETWGEKPAFQPHMTVFKAAARLFEQGEYIGAACTLLPKLEGVLRQVYVGSRSRPKATDLSEGLVGRFRLSVDGYTALLPETFIRYINHYYFRDFDGHAESAPPSRHAFLHGVGPDEHLNDPTYCLRLFLTLDQIYFCVSRMKEVAHAQES